MYNDILFFSVFRNKFLNQCIFSNLNNRDKFLGYYKYDDIISCEWCIENEYYELLKKKVQNGEYLIFTLNKKTEPKEPRNLIRQSYDGNNRSIILSRYSLYHKQVTAKSGWNSSNFYDHLFKNYPKYFIDNGNIDETEFIAIEYDNIHVLNSLSKNYNYKFKFESFFRAVEIGSMECALFIFGKIESSLVGNKKQLLELWEMVLVPNKNKIYQHINFSIGLLLNKRLDFLINKCNLKVPTSASHFKLSTIFDFLIYNQTLSTLIESCKTIIHLKDLLKPFIQSIKKGTFKSNRREAENSQSEFDRILQYERILHEVFSDTLEYFNSIEYIDQITKKFQRKQLDSLVYHFNPIPLAPVQNNNDIESVVYKLFKFVLPFTEFKSSFFSDSLKFFKLKYEKENIPNNDKGYLQSLHSIFFGIYNLYQLSEHSLSLYGLSIFKYCKNDRVRQIDYINRLLQDISKDSNILKSSKYLQNSVDSIFCGLLLQNDLELVELLLNSEFIKFNFQNEMVSIGRIYSNINSIQMFDLVYNHSKIQTIINYNYNNNNNNNNKIENINQSYLLIKFFISNNNIILLNHLRTNYPDLYFNGIKDLKLKGNFSEISVDVVKFIYDNIKDFDYDNVDIWFYDTSNINNFQFISESDYKYLIEKTPSDKKYSYQNFDFKNEIGHSMFIYLFNYKSRDIISGRCYIPERSCYQILFKYLLLKRERALDIDNHGFETKLLETIQLLDKTYGDPNGQFMLSLSNFIILFDIEIGIYGNQWFLDFLIRNKKNDIYIFAFTLLRTITSYGQFRVYKYLENNYPKLLFDLLEKDHFSNRPNRDLYSVIHFGYLDLFLEIIKNLSFTKLPKNSIYYNYIKNTYHNTANHNNYIFLNYFSNNKKK